MGAREGTIDELPGLGPLAPESRRLAAVFERGRRGEALLREASELAAAGGTLFVLALAPQARPPRWGRAGGEGPYNVAIREEARQDLRAARELLGSLADRAEFAVLAGCPLPPLAGWVTENRIGLVLLAHQRLSLGGNLYARSIRRETAAELRLVR